MALACLGGCSDSPVLEDGTLATESAPPPQKPNVVNTSQLPDSSFIYDASISDLESADHYMDGQTVQITGEVVGDRINSEFDDAYCWITLQEPSGSYSEMDVYMPFSYARAIDTYGAYGRRGTTLQVRGTFNLACSDHNGVTDLHAANVSVVGKGEVVTAPFDGMRFLPGLGLVAAGVALVVLYRVLSERRR